MYLLRRFFKPAISAGKDLAISGVGIREIMRNHAFVDRPGRADYLCMFFHGESYVRQGDVLVSSKQQLMIWDAHTPQAYGWREGDWEHSWIHIEGELLPKRMKALGIPFNRLSRCAGLEGWFTDTLHRLFNEACQSTPMPAIIGNTLDIFLLQMARGLHAEGDPMPRQVREAKALLDTYFSQEWTLGKLAKKVGVSVSFLSGQFTRFIGTAPMAYVRQLRMQQAALLLYNRDLRIGDVALSVGYKDIFHFSKAFKQTFGTSPSHYTRTQKK